MTSDGRSPARRAAAAAPRWAVEIAAWTAMTWGIWLVSLSAVSTEELIVGGGCAVGCGVVCAVIRRLVGGRWRPAARTFLPAVLVPVAVVADAAAVLAAPWRPRRWLRAGRSHRRGQDGTGGHLVTVDIGARGPSPAAAGRRAIATLVVSASPGSVVVDADPETGELVAHVFCSVGPSLLARFARP